MDSFTDRINNLVRYIESCGIHVNIGKNKARGNKGFFQVKSTAFRIDISDKLSEYEILKVLVHEFVHYIHYLNDKSLKSLEFIFGNDLYKYEEELIFLTVDSINKADIKPLFDRQTKLKEEINVLKSELKETTTFENLENSIKRTSFKHLLKYDRVKVLEGFNKVKIYSIDGIELNNKELSRNEIDFLKLNSKKRALRRINSKISRLNAYYNSPTELLARSFEYYFLQPDIMKNKSQNLFNYYKNILKDKKLEILSNLNSFF